MKKARLLCELTSSENFLFGGDEEDRTPDLCIANAALSQLSYTPKFFSRERPMSLRRRCILPKSKEKIKFFSEKLITWLQANNDFFRQQG